VTSRAIRFIGGPHDGEQSSWRVDGGDTIRVPERPDFVDYTIARDGEPPGDTMVKCRYHTYRVYRFPFVDGHVHHYAIADGIEPVQIFNHLWHAYSSSVRRSK
jgi:hypothetical protein